jgi:predicted rRNA methylase YqxC with S4 and FtsJ domains
MRKVQSHGEYLSRHFDFVGAAAVDIGCGTGDFVRWMAERGAAAIFVEPVGEIGHRRRLRAQRGVGGVSVPLWKHWDAIS